MKTGVNSVLAKKLGLEVKRRTVRERQRDVRVAQSREKQRKQIKQISLQLNYVDSAVSSVVTESLKACECELKTRQLQHELLSGIGN